jgi:hypothetical protein
MSEDIGRLNVRFGWCWLFIGVLQAMLIGLFAFSQDWLGGYTSLTRRFLRLSHISFMALPLLNVLYGHGVDGLKLGSGVKRIGSYAMIVAGVAMPVVCLMAAINGMFQLLFFIPASSFAIGVMVMAFGQLRSRP